MRKKWSDKFPEIFVHAPWEKPTGLNGHRLHKAAKENRDINAADEIVRDLVNAAYLDDIFGLCYERNPIVVAPVSNPQASTNALAASFASFLAKELEFRLATDILQTGSTGRDAKRDNWYRLTHEPSFSGPVEEGGNYIIADDVLTLGGTLAGLHGFIIDQGASVICMTTLAGSPMGRSPISLAAGTLIRLKKALDGDLAKLVRKELDYDVDCLTHREAAFLLGACGSQDDFYAGLKQGRG